MCNTYYFTVHLSFCNFTSLPPSSFTPTPHPHLSSLTRKFHPSPLTLTPPFTPHLSPPPLSLLTLTPHSHSLLSTLSSPLPSPLQTLLYPLPPHPSDLPLVTGQLWHSLELCVLCAVSQSLVWVVLHGGTLHANRQLQHGRHVHRSQQRFQLSCNYKCVTGASLYCEQ